MKWVILTVKLIIGGINRVVDQVLGFIQCRFKELNAPTDEGFWWKKLGDRIDCVDLIEQDGRYYYWSGTQYDGDIKRYTDEDIGYKWIKAIVPE
jgi:hypothetical protein